MKLSMTHTGVPSFGAVERSFRARLCATPAAHVDGTRLLAAGSIGAGAADVTADVLVPPRGAPV